MRQLGRKLLRTNDVHPQNNLFDVPGLRNQSAMVHNRSPRGRPITRRDCFWKDLAWQTSIDRLRKNSAFANSRSRRRWRCSTAAPRFRSWRGTARKSPAPSPERERIAQPLRGDGWRRPIRLLDELRETFEVELTPLGAEQVARRPRL